MANPPFVDQIRLSGYNRGQMPDHSPACFILVAAMQRYPFIFSDEKSWKLRRHLAFWTSWWLFQSFLYSFSAGIFNASYFRRLPYASLESLIYLVPHIFVAYSLMYLVIPKFLLKAKYITTVAAVMLLFLVTGVVASSMGVYVLGPIRAYFFNRNMPEHINEINFFLGLLAGLRGAITIGGLAAAIKLMKYLYTKEQRNLQLQKENISSQLQLLKAQVHPHFLFNTLNNIYAEVQQGSPVAANMVISLSEILRYMLYECQKPLVPLEKELRMLKQYMLLEQARYGDRLDLSVQLPDTNITRLQIAPLLLLPFIENCFKHGAAGMIDQPWISLDMQVINNELRMKLMNGKPATGPAHSPGIGLENATKRLELLYPGKHSLVINNEEEVFIVNLKLELDATGTAILQPQPSAAYA